MNWVLVMFSKWITKFMPRNYNLQPYNKEGETTGFRTLKWYEEQVFPIFSEYVSVVKTAIDVGSGNGRLVRFLSSFCEELICVDPMCEPKKEFINYASFVKNDFMNLSGLKCDCLFFMGSLWIINSLNRSKTRR